MDTNVNVKNEAKNINLIFSFLLSDSVFISVTNIVVTNKFIKSFNMYTKNEIIDLVNCFKS